jgi:hypothetical protein
MSASSSLAASNRSSGKRITRKSRSSLNYVGQALQQTEEERPNALELPLASSHSPEMPPVLIDPRRIEELKLIRSVKFDFSKLIRMCEELNRCFAAECYLGAAMLIRSILDHVPPIFQVGRFSEVANNYTGSKSFKASMAVLENSSRNIADHHLHTQIRSHEVLPNANRSISPTIWMCY